MHVPNLLKSNLADLWIWTLANREAGWLEEQSGKVFWNRCDLVRSLAAYCAFPARCDWLDGETLLLFYHCMKGTAVWRVPLRGLEMQLS